jgi:hypothetical protein
VAFEWVFRVKARTFAGFTVPKHESSRYASSIRTAKVCLAVRVIL